MNHVSFKNPWALVPVFGITLLLGLGGCGSDRNKMTAPDDGNTEPEIRTPASLRINSLTVTSFRSTKSNGDTWDWDPFFAGPRRADLYLQLEISGRVSYVSDTRDDAEPSSSYVFPGSVAPVRGELPVSIPYGGSIKIRLYDDDGLLGNEEITAISRDIGQLYGQDNATALDANLSTSGGVVRVRGTWVY